LYQWFNPALFSDTSGEGGEAGVGLSAPGLLIASERGRLRVAPGLYSAANTIHAGCFRDPRTQGLSSTALVLAYLASTGVGTRAPFRPAEIRAWAREKLGVDVDRRRIHEALAELVRKGILERLARGLYMIRDAARLLAELDRRLAGSRLYLVQRTRGTTDAGARGGSCAAGRGVARSSWGLVVAVLWLLVGIGVLGVVRLLTGLWGCSCRWVLLRGLRVVLGGV